MFKLNADDFQRITTQIVSLSAWIAAQSADDKNEGKAFYGETKITEEGKAHIRSKFRGFAPHLDALGAKITAMAVQEAEKSFSSPYTTWHNVKSRLDEIDNTLRRELSYATVLVLEPKEQAYFAAKEPLFGPDFESKFRTAGSFELDEASKCLALGRSTAAVFHLMRLMEIGIGATAKCLGIPDPIKPAQRNWGAILKSIKDAVDAKWPSPADRMCGDGNLFEGIFASLDAVKNPWRNATMHIENKYTEDEAEHIFIAVKGFMKKLASRVDEDGSPLS